MTRASEPGWRSQHPRSRVPGGVARRCSEMPSDLSQTKAATAQRGSARVSVGIPVYNAGAVLRCCVNSWLAQDMPSEAFEVIAVDDGSSDGSGALLDDYAEAHPTLRVIHQGTRGGPGGLGTSAPMPPTEITSSTSMPTTCSGPRRCGGWSSSPT